MSVSKMLGCKSYFEVSVLPDGNETQSPTSGYNQVTSGYECQLTKGMWIKNCYSRLRGYATWKDWFNLKGLIEPLST